MQPASAAWPSAQPCTDHHHHHHHHPLQDDLLHSALTVYETLVSRRHAPGGRQQAHPAGAAGALWPARGQQQAKAVHASSCPSKQPVVSLLCTLREPTAAPGCAPACAPQYYAALLRLPHEMPRQDKLGRIEVVISALGLEHCRDTIIGGRAGSRRCACMALPDGRPWAPDPWAEAAADELRWNHGLAARHVLKCDVPLPYPVFCPDCPAPVPPPRRRVHAQGHLRRRAQALLHRRGAADRPVGAAAGGARFACLPAGARRACCWCHGASGEVGGHKGRAVHWSCPTCCQTQAHHSACRLLPCPAVCACRTSPPAAWTPPRPCTCSARCATWRVRAAWCSRGAPALGPAWA